MIFVFSLLFLLLGLTFGIPALRKWMFMREVQKNSVSTLGTVVSTKSATGWLWAASFGNQDRPLIRYQSATGTEMILEVTTSNFIPQRSYKPGEAVEILYDKTRPGRAFTTRDWKATLIDLWVGIGTLTLSVILYSIGRIYNLPA